MFDRKILTMRDIEELNYLAGQVIVDLPYCIDKQDKKNYLDIRECEVLKELTLHDVLELSLGEIKEKYLYDIFPVARDICRKDPQMRYGMVVADAIDDEYLDNLLALRWKENLKLWTIQWDMGRRVRSKCMEFYCSEIEEMIQFVEYYKRKEGEINEKNYTIL